MACGYRMGIIGSLSFVPDGSTVTPTDDVPTWLKCAGIPTTTYTTLAEVLADTSLLRVLINSENAMDYLVRCKEWIKQNALVPTMTSNTTPSGVASASSEYSSSYSAWKVFDKDLNVSSSWVSNGTTNQWVKYRFPTAQCVKSVSIYTNFSGGDSAIKNFRVEGSNDDSEFTTIYTGTYLNQSGNQSFSFSNNESYLYYRLYILDRYTTTTSNIQFVELQYYASEEGLTDSQSAMKFIGANDYAANLLLADSDWCEAICNSEYFEDVLNIKVPTMTNDNTPSGECSANGSSGNTYPYYAFDGDDSTYWYHYSGTLPTGWDYRGIQYDFGKQTHIYVADIKKMWGAGSSSQNYSTAIAGSNDGINATLLTTVDSISLIGGTPISKRYIINGNYKCYRLYTDSSVISASALIYTLQFYGRDKGGVQSWLLSANITNKNYTTLSQVLSDTDTLTALISSHNAMDYLVTCTSWANDICSNQTAMTLIGNDNYASNKLLSDSTWLNAICNSTYFESVLNVKMPTMTSNTTPAGNVASVSDAYEGSAYQIFDNNDTTKWLSMSNGPWAKLELATPMTLNRVLLKYADVTRSDTITLTIAGSNDDVTYSTIDTVTTNLNTNNQIFAIMNGTSYKYYKFIWNGYLYVSGQYNARVATIDFYGRQDV